MTSQAAASSLCKNHFGSGASINIRVGTSAKKDDDKKPSTTTAAISMEVDTEEETVTLAQWLKKLRLDRIDTKLRDLGAEDVQDMPLLDEEDLQSLDLKKIEMKKLKRAIAKLEETD